MCAEIAGPPNGYSDGFGKSIQPGFGVCISMWGVSAARMEGKRRLARCIFRRVWPARSFSGAPLASKRGFDSRGDQKGGFGLHLQPHFGVESWMALPQQEFVEMHFSPGLGARFLSGPLASRRGLFGFQGLLGKWVTRRGSTGRAFPIKRWGGTLQFRSSWASGACPEPQRISP